MKELKIRRIENRNTGNEVCSHYLDIPVDNVVVTIGEPLRVRYKDGSFFTHELVESVEETKDELVIVTTRKIWFFTK